MAGTNPNAKIRITARGAHNGAPSSGRMVVNTSVSNQPTTRYAAATLTTLRRLSSATRDMQ